MQRGETLPVTPGWEAVLLRYEDGVSSSPCCSCYHDRPFLKQSCPLLIACPKGGKHRGLGYSLCSMQNRLWDKYQHLGGLLGRAGRINTCGWAWDGSRMGPWEKSAVLHSQQRPQLTPQEAPKLGSPCSPVLGAREGAQPSSTGVDELLAEVVPQKSFPKGDKQPTVAFWHRSQPLGD